MKGAAVLAFLTEVVLPIYAQAGWTLRRVLTDRGKEFKDAFHAGLAGGAAARQRCCSGGRAER